MQKITLLILSLLLVFFALSGCKQKKKNKNSVGFFTDKPVELLFQARKSDTNTDEVLFEGKPVLKLDSTRKYGMNVKIEHVKPDAFVRITVWKKGGPAGNIAMTTKDMHIAFYGHGILEKGKDGWNKIYLEAFIPPNYNGDKVKVFLMNDKGYPVYFAGLDVKVYSSKPYPEYDEHDVLAFRIRNKDVNYILKQRLRSFEKGVISKKTKKEFDAVMLYRGKEYPVEMRIKGDWLDHIQGNKWSFRVKMKEGNFNGMREFSIQQPGARGYINEWVIHQLLSAKDVLTSHYGFVPVKINDAGLGIYAWEEHFEKRLVESNRRREAPILKFDESAMWDINRLNLKRGDEQLIFPPVVEAAVIVPFKKKKTMKNPVLRGQFLIAQNLVNQYRYLKTPVSELFKLEPWAKFYAIANIGGTWHSFRWHNERFYYDPVASKIEPVAYDFYLTSNRVRDWLWLHPKYIMENPQRDYDKILAYYLFNDKKFMGTYLEKIHAYLFTDSLLSVYNSLRDEIGKYERWIQKEYPYYHYDYDMISENIEILKGDYREMLKMMINRPVKAELEPRPYFYDGMGIIHGLALQAYAEESGIIRVKNYYNKPLVMTGYASKKKNNLGIIRLEEPIKFPAFNKDVPIVKKDIACFFTPDKIYFKTEDSDTVYSEKVIPWPEPGLSSPRQELMKTALVRSNDFADVGNSRIVFKPGKHTFDKPVVIPAGKKVVIRPGTHLDFVKGAMFISFSPVEIAGSAAEKVIIESSDGTGMGFTVIGADARSTIQNAIFRGWNTLNYKGWILTGAVTFYESDVTIGNTAFENNHCEDALNIVRADFLLKGSQIRGAFSDGFDADFTTGRVSDCDFSDSGNDAIDFSGSRVIIENVRIDRSGDKGISGGEMSEMIIRNVTIANSNIAVASKDKSQLEIRGIAIKNCSYAFAAYRKKPEFGPAILAARNVKIENTPETYLIDLGSVVTIEDKNVIGEMRLNVDSIYGK